MAAPLGKSTRMPRGHRPWLDSPLTDDQIIRETPRMAREREICLNCELEECPNPKCPISTNSINTCSKKGGRPRKLPPPGFAEWAKGPMTNKELADKWGVGLKCIGRWKRELGLTRRKINVAKRNDEA